MFLQPDKFIGPARDPEFQPDQIVQGKVAGESVVNRRRRQVHGNGGK